MKRLSADEKVVPDKRQKMEPGTGASAPSYCDLVGLDEAFDRLVRSSSTSPAVQDELGRVWSYLELQEASMRMALNMLKSLQARVGASAETDAANGNASCQPPVVAVLMRRSNAWVAASLATMRLGAPLLGLSADLGLEAEVARNREALAEHRPQLLVLDRELSSSPAAAPLLEASKQGDVDSPLLVYSDELDQGPVPSFLQRPSSWAPRHLDDPCYLVYTGGSTSASKCVVETHRMAIHELEIYPGFGVLTPEDKVLHQTSAYWGATSFGIFDVAWSIGCCLVLITSNGTPAEVTKVIESHNISVVGIVPSVLDALPEDKCNSLRVAFTWGEPMRPATIARWGKRVALLDLLIASEYWLVLCADHRTSSPTTLAGFRPVHGAELRLLPPENRDEEINPVAVPGSVVAQVSAGQVGELYMAGPMVSAKGYTQAYLNKDAFVDLPVGPNGEPVRHYRTKDLARWRPDGSLEYCGRADGFAKVGGKWLDLAAVERDLLAAGCCEAVLLWDEQAKIRHAAVVPIESINGVASSKRFARPLAPHAAQLQVMLPPGTRLHFLKALPKNPATGKVHRTALMQQLALTVPSCSSSSSRPPKSPMAQSLDFGRACAGLIGARAGLVIPLTLLMSPGLQHFLWKGHPTLQPGTKGGHGTANGKVGSSAWLPIPEGLADRMSGLLAWYRSLCCSLSLKQLYALPYVCLLMLDASSTGLERLSQSLEGPFGSPLGAAIWICRRATGWLLDLLASAGASHARRARGGAGWSWTFWLGCPGLADSWSSACWHSWHPRGYPCKKGARLAVAALRRVLPLENASDDVKSSGNDWSRLLFRCDYCWDWLPEDTGERWHSRFYCSDCTESWRSFKRHRGAEGAVVSPDTTPLSSARGEGETPIETSVPAISPSPSAEPLVKEGAATPAGSYSKAAFKPAVDIVDFEEYEVRIARSRNPNGGAANAEQSSAAKENENLSPVARVFERSTGVPASGPGGGILTSLQSLKVISLVSALRRELGANLATGDVLQCGTLAELEELVEASAAKPAPSPQASSDEPGQHAIFAIPRFWKAPVGWTIKLDEVPEERAMRIACRALVRRHESLRAVPYRSAGDEAVADMCNNGVQALLGLSALAGLSEDTASSLRTQAGQGLWASWPRVLIAPPSGGPPLCEKGAPEENAHFEWRVFQLEADRQHDCWLKARSRGFNTPASISVLILAPARADAEKDPASPAVLSTPNDTVSAHLHVAVNHAVTDAASIVPLVSDLLELHREAKRLISERPEENDLEALSKMLLETANLPPAPNGMALMEARLKKAILPAVGPSTQGDDRLDLAHVAFAPRRRGYDHYTKLLPKAGQILEAASAVMGIPTDHLLVAALTAAFSRTTGRSEVKLSLIVPMRDGPGHGQAVANMATTRHVEIWTKGRSLFAISLDLSNRLRRREWHLSNLAEDEGDRLFINLRSIPSFHGAAPVIEPQNVNRSPTGFVRNMVEMFADQELIDAWTFWMGIRDDVDGALFTKALRKILWDLATDPLIESV